MYLSHFDLQEPPFGITPDTDYYLPRGSHREALNTLLVALRSGEGFVKLTAEVGLGKTVLLRKLLTELGEAFVTAYIPNPDISPKAMQLALASELGLKVNERMTRERLHRMLNTHLIEIARDGKRAVLLIDEAQALPPASLEFIRLLTNLETEKFKLLQVVLAGQPELDRRLAQRRFRPLRQRIGFSARLEPMDRDMVEAYINHRLRVAGPGQPSLFASRALDLIHGASAGVPRLVNILCHKALMVAWGQGLRRVDAQCVRLAIEDTENTRLPLVRRRWLAWRGEVAVVALALGASLGLAWMIGARL